MKRIHFWNTARATLDSQESRSSHFPAQVHESTSKSHAPYFGRAIPSGDMSEQCGLGAVLNPDTRRTRDHYILKKLNVAPGPSLKQTTKAANPKDENPKPLTAVSDAINMSNLLPHNN